MNVYAYKVPEKIEFYQLNYKNGRRMDRIRREEEETMMKKKSSLLQWR
jgi:hypothetical protein